MKWEEKLNSKYVVCFNKMFGLKRFCEIFQSDRVRTQLICICRLIFDMPVVLIKMTGISSHFVFQVFFLAND